MNYLIWLFAGAVLGWLTTVIIHNRRKDLLFNMVVGIAGAFVAGYLVTPMFHTQHDQPRDRQPAGPAGFAGWRRGPASGH